MVLFILPHQNVNGVHHPQNALLQCSLGFMIIGLFTHLLVLLGVDCISPPRSNSMWPSAACLGQTNVNKRDVYYFWQKHLIAASLYQSSFCLSW